MLFFVFHNSRVSSGFDSRVVSKRTSGWKPILWFLVCAFQCCLIKRKPNESQPFIVSFRAIAIWLYNLVHLQQTDESPATPRLAYHKMRRDISVDSTRWEWTSVGVCRSRPCWWRFPASPRETPCCQWWTSRRCRTDCRADEHCQFQLDPQDLARTRLTISQSLSQIFPLPVAKITNIVLATYHACVR